MIRPARVWKIRTARGPARAPLPHRTRTGTCSKRRPRRDNVSPVEPDGQPRGAAPTGGDTIRTRILNLGGAIVCRPYGTQSGRDANPRANPPATHIRHLRCRPKDAGDVGDTGCIRGAEYSHVARALPSTASTASTMSPGRQECRRDACAARHRTAWLAPGKTRVFVSWCLGVKCDEVNSPAHTKASSRQGGPFWTGPGSGIPPRTRPGGVRRDPAWNPVPIRLWAIPGSPLWRMQEKTTGKGAGRTPERRSRRRRWRGRIIAGVFRVLYS